MISQGFSGTNFNNFCDAVLYLFNVLTKTMSLDTQGSILTVNSSFFLTSKPYNNRYYHINSWLIH